MRSVRGELFALLTLAVTFVLATIVLNTPIDGGPGIYLSAVPVPRLAPTQPGTFYLLALMGAVAALLIAYAVQQSRLGVGLFAIHDDEDAAEVMGVPTYRYKLLALAISCALAGVAGGVHALFISYVTTAEVFSINVPLTVILMSVLGGTRHWAGPAVGATVITALLYAFTKGDLALAGKATTGAVLIAAILFMPQGIVPRLLQRRAAAPPAAAPPASVAPVPATEPLQAKARAAPAARTGDTLLRASGLAKSFFGVQALAGIDVEIRRGEILGPDRPQRLGQVDLHQRGQRALCGQRRPHSIRRARDRAPGGASHRACGHRAHLPDPAPVRAPERARQRGRGRDVRRRGAVGGAGAARGRPLARLHRPVGQGARPCPTR